MNKEPKLSVHAIYCWWEYAWPKRVSVRRKSLLPFGPASLSLRLVPSAPLAVVPRWIVIGLFNLAAIWPLAGQSILSFDPQAGSVGDQVVITGSGFSTGPIKVYFNNNVLDTTAQPTSDTIIYAHVPSGAITGAISVQRDSQPKVSSSANFIVVGAGPYISDVTPNAGSVNDLIIITGVHLNASPTGVKFNTTPSVDASANAAGSQISVHVPSGATSGFISVTTSAGTSNSPSPFTVIGPGPYIVSFAPWSGNVGDPILINGAHLTTVTTLKFNGVNAPSTPTSDTQIQANVPPGATTGPITVISSLGTNTTTTNFFLPPIIRSFSPATGRWGTNVLITGTNFTGATSVSFGGAVASPNVLSNFAIQVTVPMNAGSGPVRIDTPAFSDQTISNFNVQPTISGFSPTFGAAGTNVTILGTALNENLSAVKFGGIKALSSAPSFGQVVATVPVGATNGPVSVTTSNGTFITTSNFFFPATISSFTPSNGVPGSRISIKGLNFLGTTAVAFNGQTNTFYLTNNTALGAVIPAGVITGPVSLTTPAGTANSGALLFYGPPVVSSFNPTHGFPGTSVTLLGTNLLGTTTVRFNGVAVSSFSVSDNGTILTSVPSNALTGPITVVAPGGTTNSPTSFTVDFVSNLGVSMSEAPDPVFWQSNLVYTIVVTNAGPFDAANVRLTNTLPNSVTLKSARTSKGTLTTAGNMVSGALGTVANSNSVVVIVTVAPQTVGTITNKTTVTSDYFDPSPGDNLSVLTTTVLPLPFLSIGPYAPNQSLVSWPVALSNFALQFKPTLATNLYWSNWANPSFVSGTNRFIIDTSSGTSRFYRLKQ